MDLDKKQTTIGVIGAGIVGLSIAVELKRQGYQVTVIDRDEPMQGCSSGNAGYLSEANIFPPAAPDMLMQLPKLMFANDGPLVIKPTYVPEMLSWGYHALSAIKQERREWITATLADMTVQAYTALEKLSGHASASHLLSRDGGLLAFKNQDAFNKKCALLPVWERHGITVHRLSASEVRSMEPALAKDMVGGLLFENSGRCSNPQKLGLLYAEHLLRNGAEIYRDNVREIRPSHSGNVLVRGVNTERSFNKVVVCAGFWSTALLKPYVHHIPMVSERGYHLMLPTPGIQLKRPVVFGEPHFAATPMDEGLRLAGTAEFASAQSAPNYERAKMLIRLAQGYLPELNGGKGQPWMGVRPSLPDGLPAIGQAPNHSTIHYAFGHAHNGLTLSAVTAELVARQINASTQSTSNASLDLARFD